MMNTTRRGFFAFVAGAAALAVVPVKLAWHKMTTTSIHGVVGNFQRGDIITLIGSDGIAKQHVITEVEGSTLSVSRKLF